MRQRGLTLQPIFNRTAHVDILFMYVSTLFRLFHFPLDTWLFRRKTRLTLKMGVYIVNINLLAGVTRLRNHFVDCKDTTGRKNVKICTGNMPQHVTSCAAARDFLLVLPHFLKNAVVSGEKFASN